LNSTLQPQLMNSLSQLYPMYKANKNRLYWAILCSLILHILLVYVLPALKFPEPKKPGVLEIVLMPPAALKPLPVLDPVKPVKPVKPKSIEKKPVNVPKPIIKPSPISEPPTQEVTHDSTTAVITSTPKAETIQTFTAPAAVINEPAKPLGPSEADINGARGQYADMLRREIAKDKNYPNISRTRSQQGEVVLDVKLDSNGKVLSATVHTSSGYESLDREAIAKINRISPFPLPPEALKGRTFNVSVPISFKLDV